MKLVIFGLTISSSWGNGHATLWRGLCRGLNALGHEVTFFERDQPFYRAHRDLDELPGHDVVLYRGWEDLRSKHSRVSWAPSGRFRSTDASILAITRCSRGRRTLR